jgi:HEAT repeat protein
VLGTIRSERFYEHKPVGHWIHLLGDADPAVRAEAANALGEMGADAAQAVPSLTRALKDPAEDVRSAAAIALTKMGDRASSATMSLAECLNDPSVNVRMNAAVALTRFGPDAGAAVPMLIEAMTQMRNYEVAKPFALSVRQQVTRAIAAIGPGARDAIPVLVEALHDGQAGVRANAAFALGRIRAADESILSQLRLATADEDEFVRIRAAEALANIESVSRDESLSQNQ